MEIKKEDRRVQRTRNMLFDALIDLMIEKGYEALTVQNIIDRANVGRSTFYAHFFDKEQLLIGNIDRLREFLVEQIAKHSLPKEESEFKFGFSLVMLQHVQSHKRLYRAIASKQSEMLVLLHMKRMLAHLAEDEIARYWSRFGSIQIPYDVAAEFAVTTFLTVLTWWMERNMSCTAEECDRLYHKLIFSGISASRELDKQQNKMFAPRLSASDSDMLPLE
ncbi:TetR/AcrR family transcriptional regulator [Cohnella suwonensis]|uniref:TetR/AcrR family transcriptional regulator n=1 Tax=Cohnella suwonensis TaxID=696072 RepID=A0ABW0LZV6_9BACL